jgi:hypothetical protein
MKGVVHLVPGPTSSARCSDSGRSVSSASFTIRWRQTRGWPAVEQLRRLAPQFQYELIEAPLRSGQEPAFSEIGEAMHRLIERAAMIVGLRAPPGYQ